MKRTFTQKLAWIEYWNQVSAVTITESMERFGVEKYLRQYIPGKCVAITEVSFTQGDGNPPQY